MTLSNNGNNFGPATSGTSRTVSVDVKAKSQVVCPSTVSVHNFSAHLAMNVNEQRAYGGVTRCWKKIKLPCVLGQTNKGPTASYILLRVYPLVLLFFMTQSSLFSQLCWLRKNFPFVAQGDDWSPISSENACHHCLPAFRPPIPQVRLKRASCKS